MQRREFLRWTAASSAVVGAGFRVWGNEPATPEAMYARFVPGDKGLDPGWLASLTNRGHVLDAGIRHRAGEVDPAIIGMTVGGIGCGTVYLSGDGRLWVWDIFNQHHEGVVANNKAEIPAGLGNIGGRKRPMERDGANFLRPPGADDHRNGVDLKFSLKLGDRELPMDATGWKDVSFTGRWPMGVVEYAAEDVPVEVMLEAFSPFVPLDLASSSLPLTVMEYTVRNPSKDAVKVTLRGQFNNPAGQFSKLEAMRFSEPLANDTLRGVLHGVRDGEGKLPVVGDAGTMVLAVTGRPEARVDAGRGSVAVELVVPAAGEVKVSFLVAWHFPQLHDKVAKGRKRSYATRFADAGKVAAHYAAEEKRLAGLTRKWVDVWNDSTLPQWLLDRSILTTNTLQTECCFLLDDGRFWAWEGIGCCPGTCGHVWQYAQGHARLFPGIERMLREKTDFATAQNPDGSIRFRGTNANTVAIDSQCAYVLRTLRDHQLSDDPGYLKRVWEPVKRAIRYLVEFDRADPRGGLDGLLDGMQHNTLDAEWYGKVHVLCTMYLAALRAGEELAKAMDDPDFAAELHAIYQKGAENIARLFNGEFYIQDEDPSKLKAIGVGTGCYIDQVMGQYWANQVGLGRIFNAEHQKSALRALWKYNFVPEYGSFRQAFPEGRHYAVKGDSGLLMCTWPKGGLRDDFRKHWQYAYFNEFMTGFEYEAAAHMVAEGDEDLVRNGLAVTRAIHDRYSAARGRNPYNEIECSDHYARAGSSYAVFLAACGFGFDQSKGWLAFAPVIQKDHFRAPFTTSKAWGTYEQKDGRATITLRHGELEIRDLDLGIFRGKKTAMKLNGKPVDPGAIRMMEGDRLEVGVV